MRVISGQAKGRRLKPVPGEGTRPITDRVKENLFNVLQSQLSEARVLDLFAGTGGVGIEALSRGASQAVFVENSRQAIQVIRENLTATGLAAAAQVVRADVFAYLSGDPPAPFDLIYVAPPQYQELWAKAVLAVDTHPAWLTPNGVVIVQIFPKEYHPLALTHLTLVDQRTYGSTMLCFYRLTTGVEKDTP